MPLLGTGGLLQRTPPRSQELGIPRAEALLAQSVLPPAALFLSAVRFSSPTDSIPSQQPCCIGPHLPPLSSWGVASSTCHPL